MLLTAQFVNSWNVFRFQASLESITKSLQSLDLSIRTNGCLYNAEAKSFIRFTTALAEYQLLEMPKTHLVSLCLKLLIRTWRYL